MNALVTGATGFTGKALCKRLVQEGHRVFAFVRPSSDIAELRQMGVVCLKVDIKSSEEVQKDFPEVDWVFHIAAAYRAEHVDQEEFSRVNVGATGNLLDAAKIRQVDRFVHCSTVGVQGEIKEPPADETYRFNPGDHYQQSKLDGELLARRYFEDGLRGVVIRPVGIYGPGDLRFLKLFRPISKNRFVMIGAGKVLYHMTYIDDLVEGFMLAATRDQALGEVFTIAGPNYTTLLELVNTIAEILGKRRSRLRIPFAPVYAASVVCDKVCRAIGVSPPIYPRRVEFFALDRAFSIEKARKLLGYDPQVPLRKGIEKTARWYQDTGLI